MLKVHFKPNEDLVFEIEENRVTVSNEELDKILPLLMVKSMQVSNSKLKMFTDSKGNGIFSIMDLRESE